MSLISRATSSASAATTSGVEQSSQVTTTSSRASTTERRFALSLVDAFELIRGGLDVADVTASLVRAENPHLDWLAIDSATTGSLMALLEHIAKQSALDELPHLQKQLAEQYAERISLEFMLRNLDAEEFLRGYDFSLIHRISDETRQAIAYLVRRSFQLGIPPHRIALAIRDCLFLPASAIPAYLSQRSYLDEQRVPEKVALSSMSRWAKQRLDSRGELIARTETLRALNYGKIALWDRAMASGYLHPLSTQKEWIVAEDERLCPHCAPLDGEDVPLLESWQTTLGTVSQPPLHPACRCTMGLVFKPQVQTSLLT